MYKIFQRNIQILLNPIIFELEKQDKTIYILSRNGKGEIINYF